MPQFVLRGAPSTISCVFDVDGAPAELDSPPTVTILASDGTEIVSAAATTSANDQYEYKLAPRADLDTLTCTWSGELESTDVTVETVVEVIGQTLFSVQAARQRKALAQSNRFTNAKLRLAHDLALQALEDACNVGFVPHRRKESLDGSGQVSLILPTPRVQTINAVTIDGESIDVDDLSLKGDSGILRRSGGWPCGLDNVEVDYVHGHRLPPMRIARAALLLAENWLIETAIPDRATSLSTEDGQMQFLVTAGVRGAKFDIPEVNAAVDEYSWSDVGVG